MRIWESEEKANWCIWFFFHLNFLNVKKLAVVLLCSRSRFLHLIMLPFIYDWLNVLGCVRMRTQHVFSGELGSQIAVKHFKSTINFCFLIRFDLYKSRTELGNGRDHLRKVRFLFAFDFKSFKSLLIYNTESIFPNKVWWIAVSFNAL